MKPVILALLVLSSAIVAGCTEARNEAEPEPATFAVRKALWHPTILNSTLDDRLALEVRLQPKCPFTYLEQRMTLFIHDRMGLIHWEEIVIDWNGTWIDRPLDGEPPHVISASPPPCLDFHESRIVNVTSGFRSISDYVRWKSFHVNISAGENTSTIAWDPGEFTFRMWPFWTDVVEREGNMYGTTEFRDSQGRLVRKDAFHLFSGADVEFDRIYHVPGPYTITVTLDQPSIGETSWLTWSQYFHFRPEFCELGFEWSMCKDTERHENDSPGGTA